MPRPQQDSPTPKAITGLVEAAGLSVSRQQAEQLSTYLDVLTSWNKRMNLVGPGTWPDIFQELILDSFHLAAYLGQQAPALAADATVLDLGAGAGIPGIPLRILWGQGSYTLVEIREKRVVFLRFALSKLGLARTTVDDRRAEELFDPAAPASIILSRAFMPWQELLPFARSGLADDGLLLVMAREPWTPELESQVPQGWAITGTHEYPGPRQPRYFWSFTPIMA